MKKFIIFLFLVFNSLYAYGTYDGVYFNDYEVNASLYYCNYYPRQSFIDLGISSSDATTIVNGRNTLYTSLSQVAALSGIVESDMQKIKSQSHLIDWNVYTDDLGMTLHQTNFIYALTGVLIGFTFLFAFIQIIMRKA